MIRKLNDHDHPAVMSLLAREPELNLFIIGDIENVGYEHEQVMHWGEFDRAGRVVAVLTRYFDSLVFYAREACDHEGFLRLIDTLDYHFFSAESSIIEPFAARLAHERRKDTLLSRLTRERAGRWEGACGVVRPATLADVERITALRRTIPEFEVIPDSGMLYQTLAQKEGRAWVIEEGGRLVAVAQTAAESFGLAMIVGVGTHPKFRRRGYATACMTELCQTLLEEGKTLCLFYDNPEAGRIYKRLGFEDIGRWSMLIR